MPRQCARWVVTGLLGLVIGWLAPPGRADTLVFSTADHSLYTRLMTRTQGWWSSAPSHPSVPGNDNYIVGANAGGLFRDFFCFDLAALDLTHQTVVSARLEVTQYEYDSLSPSETLGLFDVNTPPEALCLQGGFDQAIWEDLGTGKNYGMFTMKPYASVYDRWNTIGFDLNSAALEDITSAAGGWFSIGGSLQGADLAAGGPLAAEPGDTRTVFSAGGGGPVQQLVIETAPATAPEPAGLALLLVGALPLTRRITARCTGPRWPVRSAGTRPG